MLDLCRAETAAHRIHLRLEPQANAFTAWLAERLQAPECWPAVPLARPALLVGVMPDQLLGSDQSREGR